MPEQDHAHLSADTAIAAFDIMGRYLRERELLGEIAIYGGMAILLQFGWRKTTKDVDAVIRTGERESAVKDAAAYAGLELRLPDDWLNNYVGGFTAETEPEAFFSVYGSYPRGETAGLRVFLAKPQYLCAMKLKALERATADDRDFKDVVKLAKVTGVGTAEQLADLFASFFPDETLGPLASARLPEAEEAIQATP